jgi:hypothetical protein
VCCRRGAAGCSWAGHGMLTHNFKSTHPTPPHPPHRPTSHPTSHPLSHQPRYQPPPLTCEEEGVVRVAGWVLLRLEQGIKVPEGGLHVVVGGHLLKAHLGEDLAELGAHLQGGC